VGERGDGRAVGRRDDAQQDVPGVERGVPSRLGLDHRALDRAAGRSVEADAHRAS
jgi:hypothetical protein